MADEFIAYRGDSDIHDGEVVEVRSEGDGVCVVVRGASGRSHELCFKGVGSMTQHRAVGMKLYALAEMAAYAPLRRFVFANWDETDDASLEVNAVEFESRPPPDSRPDG